MYGGIAFLVFTVLKTKQTFKKLSLFARGLDCLSKIEKYVDVLCTQ